MDLSYVSKWFGVIRRSQTFGREVEMARRLVMVGLAMVFVLALSGTLRAENAEIKLTTPGSNVPASTKDNDVMTLMNNVDLSSGSHAESFPLMSLDARNGLGIALSLEYSGRLEGSAKKENRLAQASPFGLGFDLNLPYVVSSHMGTSYLYDDSYTLRFQGVVAKLLPVGTQIGDTTVYVPQTGEPWKVMRLTAQYEGRPTIIGWKVIDQSGYVYVFGDMDNAFQTRNSTWLTFRYGNYVGSNCVVGDDIYPWRWELSCIRDADSLSYLSLSYDQDTVYLTVVDPQTGTTTTSSDHTYTRSVRLSSITSCTGSRISVLYTRRQDFQPYFAPYMFDYYDTVMVDRMIRYNPRDSIVGELRFDHTYLNQEYDAKYKKLLLGQIVATGHDTTEFLPPTTFEYYTDTSALEFGRLSSITHGGGSVEEVLYSSLADSSNFASLSSEGDIQPPSLPDAARAENYLSDGMFVGSRNPYVYRYLLGYWNGYWDIDTVEIPFGAAQISTSDYGYAVFLLPSDAGILIKSWRGGFWRTDTVDVDLTLRNHSSIYTGEDCFVVTTGDNNARSVRQAAFVVWNGSQWRGFRVVDANDEWRDSWVKISNKMFGLSLYYWLEEDYGDFRYYKYYQPSDSIISGFYGATTDFCPGDRFVANQDLVAFLGAHRLYWKKWEDSCWSAQWSVQRETTNWTARAIAAIPNGLVWAYDNGTGNYAHIDGLFFSADTMAVHGYAFDPNEGYIVDEMWSGPHSLIVRYAGTGNTGLWTWKGTRFEPELYIETTVNNRVATIFSSSFSWGYPYDDPTTLRLGTYEGGGNWSDSIFVRTATEEQSYAEDYSVALRDTILERYRKGDYAEPWQWLIDTIRVWPYTGQLDLFSGKDNLALGNSVAPILDVRHLLDNKCDGKAPLFVVSQLRIKQHSEDSLPIVVDFDYFGAILNQGGETPRFAKAVVSQPYYSSDSPQGYTAHCFYNDIDDDWASDSLYQSGCAPYPCYEFPDLESASYGIVNGGYLLDGLEYSSFSYNASAPDSTIDSTFLQYRVIAHPDTSLNEVYHKQLVESRSWSEGQYSEVRYQYDSTTGGPLSSRTLLSADSSYWSVDSLVPAWTVDTSIEADNALDLPYQHLTYIDSAGVLSLTSRQQSYYEKVGYWRPKYSYEWHDLSASDTSDAGVVCTYATLDEQSASYDSLGNAINSVGVTGAIASVKIAADGNYTVASAVNCPSWAFLSQDFEQGDNWDGWHLNVFRTGVDTVSSEAFTGQRCLRLIDSAYADTYKVWGPSRRIMADSLQDTLYYVSAWVKANTPCFIYVWSFSADSTNLKYDICNYTPSSPVNSADWVKVEHLFAIPRIYGADTVHHVDVILGELDAAFDTNYVYIDDFRMYPVGASVVTTVYDDVSGQPIAGSGPDGMPAMTEYDSFGRPTLRRNAHGVVLSKTEYVTSTPIIAQDTLSRALDEEGTIIERITIDHNQDVSWTLSLYSESGFSPQGNALLERRRGAAVDTLGFVECTGWSCGGLHEESDTFPAERNDTIVLTLRNWGVLFPPELGGTVYYERISAGYDPSHPHLTRSIAYNGAGDSTTSISYSDALGRPLQTRSISSDGGTQRTLVTGTGSYDALGRQVKAYLPYYDLVGDTGLEDYTPISDVLQEAEACYDGSPGPDCGAFPYQESEYENSVKGRLVRSALSGVDHNMTTTHTTRYTYEVYPDSTVTAVADPDSVVTRSIKDRWGLSKRTASLFNQCGDSVITLSRKTLRGDTAWVEIDTGTTPIMLRQSVFDDAGREIETWRVDYGTVRSIYDESGQLRFMQNEKRRQEGTFVYFKYDALGRKIEEGLITDSSYWSQSYADLASFPGTVETPDVRYRWYYDVYDTIVAPGKLVRVESADTSYYQNFYRWPMEHKDLVVTKLPIVGGSLKAVKHEYYPDGALRTVTVYPYYPGPTGQRQFCYTYDAAGRPECVYIDVFTDSLNYATWTYNADGSLATTILGEWYHHAVEPVVEYDTVVVQKVDYTYNALGALIAMNLNSEHDSTSIVATPYGGVTDSTDNNHFGEWITYWDSTGGYYNGRLKKFKSYNSTSSAGYRRERGFGCSVDELARLFHASSIGSFTNSRHYELNDLSSRTKLVREYLDDTVTYVYDTTSPGSSRLLRTSEMGGYRMHYDVLGNLVSDSSRSIFQQDYDYRNLMTYAVVAPTASGSNSTLDFAYDQGGQRIHKKFHYQYWDDCNINPEDTGIFPDGGTLGLDGGGGGTQCRFWATSQTFYLYDNGVLLCTFDQNDDVEELFVNSAHGPVAEYWKNDNQYLYFFLKDHLGTPRVYMQGPPTDTTVHVGFYANYYPFGELLERGGNIFSDFAFTGKERDIHSSFDYYYSGSRYYDPRTGTFTGVDKAGQFASGYIYGGNNPAMMLDPDGELAWFVPIIIGAVAGGYSGASIVSGGNWDFRNWDSDWWKGAVIGSVLGATAGASFASYAHASGMTTTAQTASGIVNVPTKAWGITSTALSSGTVNIGISGALQHGTDGMWKAGLVGLGSGIYTATRGFGLAKLGFFGRLGAQAVGSSAESIGYNWAAGEKAFSRVTLGVGPINLTLGEGQKLVQWQNNLGNITYNAVGMTNTLFLGGDMRIDWRNLTPVYYGGAIKSVYDRANIEATGAHVVFSRFRNLSDDYLKHEMTHVWQSRLLGDPFMLNYLLQYCYPLLMGENQYYVNFWEYQAGY